MKGILALFVCLFILVSCSLKPEGENPNPDEMIATEATSDSQIELSGNEMTLGAEEELSRDLNNLLNDVSNEQE